MIIDELRFWTFLFLMIPSSICSIILLYYFTFDRLLRQALHNHLIIVVLIIGFICIVTIYPWMLYFYSSNGIWIRTSMFCSVWKFIDWALYTTHTILFAWTTIERHILIFHPKWIESKSQKIFIHYLPMIFLLLYCFLFYTIILFFLPCQNYYFNSVMMCMISCYTLYRTIYKFEMIVHQILPYGLIMFGSLTLILRVVREKSRRHRPMDWRRYRQLTIQLLTIAFVYLIFFFPLTLFKFLIEIGFVDRVPTRWNYYATYLSYFVVLLFPFFCVVSLPELRKILKKHFYFRRQVRMIVPII